MRQTIPIPSSSAGGAVPPPPTLRGKRWATRRRRKEGSLSLSRVLAMENRNATPSPWKVHMVRQPWAAGHRSGGKGNGQRKENAVATRHICCPSSDLCSMYSWLCQFATHWVSQAQWHPAQGALVSLVENRDFLPIPNRGTTGGGHRDIGSRGRRGPVGVASLIKGLATDQSLSMAPNSPTY